MIVRCTTPLTHLRQFFFPAPQMLLPFSRRRKLVWQLKVVLLLDAQEPHFELREVHVVLSW
jgi:hypothetical protein